MDTIYITEIEFHIFLHQHYLIVTKKSFNFTKTKTVHIQYKQLLEFERSRVLFLSGIESISLSNNTFAPQLKVLYGIPSGLLSFRNESSNVSNSKYEIQQSESDKLFIHIRRALLFMQVWSIKNMDVVNAETNLLNLLNSKTSTHQSLLFDIIKTTTVQNDFPQVKPQTLSLDDTIFDYQINWFGRLICQHLFKGMRMNDEVRSWYLNCLSINPISIPVDLKDYESIVTGYVLALKAYNKGRNDVNYFLQLLNDTSYVHLPIKMEILSIALFFVGLLENKADRYFMTSSAGELFYSLETIAYSLAKQANKEVASIQINGYESIKQAMLNPIENCVKYYKAKNPSIKNITYYKYGTNEGNYKEMIPVIEPQDVLQFLKNHRLVHTFGKMLENKLLVTQNKMFYQLASKLTQNVLYINELNTITGSLDSLNLKSELYTDSKLLMRFFNKLSIKFKDTVSIFAQLKKEWILITGDYKISEEQKKLLLYAASYFAPQKVYLFNFAASKSSRINEGFDTLPNNRDIIKKKKGERGVIESESDKCLIYNNSTLQSEVKFMFPHTEVRVVSKESTDSPWEMVNLGIGLLQDTNISNCTIIETRNQGYQPDNYITIARCFSDIIIYDDQQRYMFLNL